MDRDMNQELERTEELMQAASGKSKKKKILIIAVIATTAINARHS